MKSSTIPPKKTDKRKMKLKAHPANAQKSSPRKAGAQKASLRKTHTQKPSEKEPAETGAVRETPKRKIPPFFIVLLSVVVLASAAVAVLNGYIKDRLSEYEAAQPRHAAQRIFESYFQNPDFAALINASGYVLREGETLENAVEYFQGLAAGAQLTLSQVTSAFEERDDALAFLVRAGEVNLAKLTLVPSGQFTKHGHPLYEDGGVMLIRRDRPELPEPSVTPSPEPVPSPTPEPIRYSEALQKEYSDLALETALAFSLRSRNKLSKPETLKFFEPGSDIYNRINAMGSGYVQMYDEYKIEDTVMDEFLELEDGAFSCRVRYAFRMIRAGTEDQVDRLDYILKFRPNNKGKMLVYDMYVTGSYIEPEPEDPEPLISAPAAAAAVVDGYVQSRLTDGSRASAVTIKKGQTVTVTADAPVRYVYVVWDRPPVSPKLTVNGKTLDSGGYGFLHEFFLLNEPSGKLELTVGGDSTLCEIYMLTEGLLPDWVQQWKPPLSKADMLVVAPRAGDELLYYGGVLPLYAGEMGLAVQTAVMITPEDGVQHELLDGLWAAGVTVYPVIGPFEDDGGAEDSLAAAESLYGRDRALAYQTELLRRFKPVVVLGPDINGAAGRGAGMFFAQTLAEALTLSSSAKTHPQSAAAYGVWDVPKAYLHLYPENRLTMDWSVPLAGFGGQTAYEAAREAFTRYESLADALPAQSGIRDCRLFGLFRSTVGPDTAGNDLFENVIQP